MATSRSGVAFTLSVRIWPASGVPQIASTCGVMTWAALLALVTVVSSNAARLAAIRPVSRERWMVARFMPLTVPKRDFQLSDNLKFAVGVAPVTPSRIAIFSFCCQDRLRTLH